MPLLNQMGRQKCQSYQDMRYFIFHSQLCIHVAVNIEYWAMLNLNYWTQLFWHIKVTILYAIFISRFLFFFFCRPKQHKWIKEMWPIPRVKWHSVIRQEMISRETYLSLVDMALNMVRCSRNRHSVTTLTNVTERVKSMETPENSGFMGWGRWK